MYSCYHGYLDFVVASHSGFAEHRKSNSIYKTIFFQQWFSSDIEQGPGGIQFDHRSNVIFGIYTDQEHNYLLFNTVCTKRKTQQMTHIFTECLTVNELIFLKIELMQMKKVSAKCFHHADNYVLKVWIDEKFI